MVTSIILKAPSHDLCWAALSYSISSFCVRAVFSFRNVDAFQKLQQTITSAGPPVLLLCSAAISLNLKERIICRGTLVNYLLVTMIVWSSITLQVRRLACQAVGLLVGELYKSLKLQQRQAWRQRSCHKSPAVRNTDCSRNRSTSTGCSSSRWQPLANFADLDTCPPWQYRERPWVCSDQVRPELRAAGLGDSRYDRWKA